jgi:subtilisin family serine protease
MARFGSGSKELLVERTFFRQGRPVHVEQLDGIVAIRVEPEARSLEPEMAPASRDTMDTYGIGPAQVSTFGRANWFFVEDTPQVRERFAARTTQEVPHYVVRDEDGRISVVGDRLIVKLSPNLSDSQVRKFFRESGTEIVRKLPFSSNLYEVRAIDGGDAIDKSMQLHGKQDVVYAEPDLIQEIAGRARPTDPRYTEQWQWANVGANGGIEGADVNAEKAWDITRGGSVRVGVIDNGFDYSHEDLAANVDPASAFYDANGNFVKNVHGMPDGAHGTFCAAQIAAVADNAKGGCGVAPDAKLVLIAVLPDQIGTQSTLARGIAYAADPRTESQTDAPVDVLACSLGDGADWSLSSVLDDALKFAEQHGRGGLGLSIFWAVANTQSALSRDKVVSHPAVTRVGRSTNRDTDDGSAFGPELDFLAPGVAVFNATSTHSGQYRLWTGTSFAAPSAAGIAALVLSIAPKMKAADLRSLLHSTCDKIGALPYAGGRNNTFGYGRLNAGRAVLGAQGLKLTELESTVAARSAARC